MRRRLLGVVLVGALCSGVLFRPHASAQIWAANNIATTTEDNSRDTDSGRVDEILALLLELDLRRQALAEQIASGKTALAGLRVEMEELQRKVRAGRTDIDWQRRESGKRIGIMARMQPVDWLEILLGAESFADFVGRWDAIQQLLANDHAQLERLQQARQRQQGHLVSLAARFELAEWQQAQLITMEQEAITTAAALEAELAALADQRGAYEARLADLQAEWQTAVPALQAVLERLTSLEEHFAAVDADLKLSLVPFRAVVTVEAKALEDYLGAGGQDQWQVGLADNSLTLSHPAATITIGGPLRGEGDAVIWEINSLTFSGVSIPRERQSAWIERSLLHIRPADLPVPYQVASVTATHGQLVLDLRSR